MGIDQWSVVAGFILPVFIAVVNHEPWSPMVKGIIALVASIAGGTLTALLNHGFDGANWITAVGIAFGSSQFFYKVWFKNSGITTWIEQNTNWLGALTGASKPADGDQ